MNEQWFRVSEDFSFYDDMVGKLVEEFDKTYLLEFKMGPKLGGVQKVMFYKQQAFPEKMI